MLSIFGSGRIVTIARELTKLFETIKTAPLEEISIWLQSDSNQQKGEFVLLVEGAELQEKTLLSEQTQHTLKCLLAELPLRQAVKLAAEITAENKNTLYQFALEIKKTHDA